MMRMFMMVVFATVLTSNAVLAQSPRLTDWAGKSTGVWDIIIDDEPQALPWGTWFRCPNGAYISAIRCAGESCRNRQYQCTTGFKTKTQAAFKKKGKSKRKRMTFVLIGKNSVRSTDTIIYPAAGNKKLKPILGGNCADDSRYPEGRFVIGAEGQVMLCRPFVSVGGTSPVCGGADQTKTISAGETLKLKMNEIVQSMMCDSVYCKNLEVTWCGLYGGDKENIKAYLTGMRWKRMGSMTGGSQQWTYTFGVEDTTGLSEESVVGSSESSSIGSSESQSSGSSSSNSRGTSSGQAYGGTSSFGESLTFYAEATIGVSVSAGFMGTGAEASASATAGVSNTNDSSTSSTAERSSSTTSETSFENTQDFSSTQLREFAIEQSTEFANTWNREFSKKSERAVTVSCDQVPGADFRQNYYAFALKADNGLEAVMGHGYQLCTYGATEAPEPVCLPNDCDNAFATNCQKCRNASIGQIFSKPATKVFPKYINVARDFGSFVEFEGEWKWAKERRTGTSYLVLFNGIQNSSTKKEYTLCHFDRFDSEDKPQCDKYRGYYTEKPRGAQLDLIGVFEKESLTRFTRIGDGTLAAKFWANGRNASLSSKEPDGTAEFTQVIHIGSLGAN